jgi:hypothetical protein
MNAKRIFPFFLLQRAAFSLACTLNEFEAENHRKARTISPNANPMALCSCFLLTELVLVCTLTFDMLQQSGP